MTCRNAKEQVKSVIVQRDGMTHGIELENFLEIAILLRFGVDFLLFSFFEAGVGRSFSFLSQPQL